MSRRPSLAEQRRQLRETRASRAVPRPERPCEHCGTTIPGSDQPGRGRPKRWCSDDCRKAAYIERAAQRPPVNLDGDTPAPPPAPPRTPPERPAPTRPAPTRVELPPPSQRELTRTELVALLQNLVSQALRKQLVGDVHNACVELAQVMAPPPKLKLAELAELVKTDRAAMRLLVAMLTQQATRKQLGDVHEACLEFARIMMLPDSGASLSVAV